MDLAEFLLARLAEDEATATAGAGPHGASFQGRSFSLSFDRVIEDAYDMLGREIDEHITRWDPPRALAEVEAKRRIIKLHEDEGASQGFTDGEYGVLPHSCGTCGSFGEYGVTWPCATLRALTLPYADHPECHPSWLPPVKV